MKTTIFVLFVCISYAGYSVGALDMKSRAETPAGDDPIRVHWPLGEKSPGIAGCLVTAPSHKVRIQSLKTSDGTVYSRQLVTTADLPCFTKNTTKTLPAATTIANCAEATAKEGLNSFLWEGSNCTAYLAWRPRTRADCREGGSKVVYVVTKPLRPFSGGELVASGAIRYGVPQTYVDFSTHYDYCGFGVAVSKGYKLRLNDTQEVTVPESTTTHSMDYKILCFGSLNVSLWSLDADGEVNTNEVNLTIDRGRSRFYGLRAGGCFYLSQSTNTYSGSIKDCISWGLPTLFFENVDGEAAAFLGALNALDVYPNVFVGLTNVEGKWTWMGGLVQPNEDSKVWSKPQTMVVYTCAATIGVVNSSNLIDAYYCDAQLNVACYYSTI